MMNNTIDVRALINLASEIHQQNVDAGWWKNPRSPAAIWCLFHSELSEATEGLRKDLMDNHLTAYPMWHVELADFAIRVLDWKGSQFTDEVMADIIKQVTNAYPVPPFGDDEIAPLEFIADLHASLSDAWNHVSDAGPMTPRKRFMVTSILIEALKTTLTAAHYHNFDLMTIIKEKRDYNKTRKDHKPDVRAQAGGKKF